MTLISTGQLSTMRTLANKSLAGTAIITRPSNASDGQGGYEQTFAASGTVACNLAPVVRRSTAENPTADRLAAVTEWYLTVPALTDVALTDRVVVAGGTFEVSSMREPRSVEIVRRAVLTQIT